MMNKICTQCKIKKALSEYYKRPSRPCGYHSSCKKCSIATGRTSKLKDPIRHQKYKEYLKRYPKTEKGKVARSRYEKSKKGKKIRARYEPTEETKERNRKRASEYCRRPEIRKRCREYHRKYHAKRSKVDPEYRIARNLRSRLNRALKNNKKTGSAIDELGCSVSEFRTYIENLFYNRMSWDNYGTYWELDHIIPLFSLELTELDQFRIACHYTNIRPLTCKENRSRKKK